VPIKGLQVAIVEKDVENAYRKAILWNGPHQNSILLMGVFFLATPMGGLGLKLKKLRQKGIKH
jgi:hypothetical protein